MSNILLSFSVYHWF